MACHTASSGGYRRQFYSDSEATAQCELLSTAPNRNILTYTVQFFELFDVESNHDLEVRVKGQ